MKHFSTLLILLLPTALMAQNVEIVYNQDYTATLNGTSVDNMTSYEEIVSLLGEPEIYKEYPSGKTNFHYKELGVVVHTVNGKLLTLGVNYNWDGDENFPNTTFKGNLKIGQESIDHKTKEEIVSELNMFEIECVLPGMCMNNPRKVKNPILLGFKDQLITQVSIEFH